MLSRQGQGELPVPPATVQGLAAPVTVGAEGGHPQDHPGSHRQHPHRLCQGSAINLMICTLAFQEDPAETAGHG